MLRSAAPTLVLMATISGWAASALIGKNAEAAEVQQDFDAELNSTTPLVGETDSVPPIEFNRDIRPLLSENCFYCHGQDPNHRESGLRLDLRTDAVDYGALVPGDADGSLIVQRIESTDPSLQMPPPDSNRVLSTEQQTLICRWIDERDGDYQPHWAFTAPVRPAVPDVAERDWSKNPIDRYVLATLESHQVEHSPPADKATLIKRLSIDLIGLPPTEREIAEFVADESDLAYPKLVDRLLASERYGQRMSLPWLDAARYADSNGFQQDGDTWQWIWRDWVVNSMNADMPFDRFTIWQLAGDLLPDPSDEQLIASGFNRNHMLNGEGGAIAEEQRFNGLFDRVDTTATTWLGLTVACAQCHDHKYDPILQTEYYQLLDLFNHVSESGRPKYYSKRIRVEPPLVELPTDENRRVIGDYETRIATLVGQTAHDLEIAFAGWKQGLQSDDSFPPGILSKLSAQLKQKLQDPKLDLSADEQVDLDRELQKIFDADVVSKLTDQIPLLSELERMRKELSEYRNDQVPRVMVMNDDKPRQSHVLERGAYLAKADEVSFDTPQILPSMPESFAKNRLGFAQWLMMSDHPLTSRVQVNRMWQHFFGTGLVKTSEDFGVQSEYPLHKGLLDFLAVEFQRCGWSVKWMHRMIVTSQTYQQSSRLRDWHRSDDLDNRLLSRASRFRMPAMVLRDWALAAAGLLNNQVGGAPVYPVQPVGVWDSLAITEERDFTYPQSVGEQLFRRSLYTFWRRTVGPANMFDASSRQTCRVQPGNTSTPLHALTTLNDPTWVQAAQTLAAKHWEVDLNEQTAISKAFESVLCRPIADRELTCLVDLYERQLDFFSQQPTASNDFLASLEFQSKLTSTNSGDAINWLAPTLAERDRLAALSVVCLGILNLDEALSRE